MTKTVKLNRDCQFCIDSTPATWDAKSTMGPWGYMCDNHFKTMAHPGFAQAATKLERETPKPEATKEIFPPSDSAAYGSTKYFERAMAAGYFGCDDDQQYAFKWVTA